MTSHVESPIGAAPVDVARNEEKAVSSTAFTGQVGDWLRAAPRKLALWIKRRLTRVATYILIALALLAWRQLSSHAIRLAVVALPESLSKTELSARELTQRLADKLDSLTQAAGTSETGGVFALESDVEVPAIEVPGVGMTLPKLLELMTGALGISRRRAVWEISARPQTSGARSASPNQVWLLTAHLSGGRSHQVPFDPSNPEPALSAIAREILGDVEPIILVRALLFGQDCESARARATAHLRRVSSPKEIARVYNTLGLAAECPFRDDETGTDDTPNWGEAERYYRAAIALDRDAVMPSVNLARIRVQQGGLPPATARQVFLAFDSAANRDPKLAEVQEAWGYSFSLIGQPDSAIKHLKKAIELDPTKPVTYRILAQMYHQVDSAADAIHAFSLTLARDPNDVTALREYGHTLLEMDDPVGASRAFARAYHADTSDDGTLFYLGRALQAAGRDAALNVFCRVKARTTPRDQYYLSADSAIAAMMKVGYRGCPIVRAAAGQVR